MKETIIAAANFLLKESRWVTLKEVKDYLNKVLPTLEVNFVTINEALEENFTRGTNNYTIEYTNKIHKLEKYNLTAVLDQHYKDEVFLKFKKVDKTIREYRVILSHRDEFGYLYFVHEGVNKKCLLKNVVQINNYQVC